jgi:hypothetical protein
MAAIHEFSIIDTEAAYKDPGEAGPADIRRVDR